MRAFSCSVRNTRCLALASRSLPRRGLAGRSLAGGSLLDCGLAGRSLLRSCLLGRCLAGGCLLDCGLAGRSLLGGCLLGRCLAGGCLLDCGLAGRSLLGRSLLGNAFLAGALRAGAFFATAFLAGAFFAAAFLAGALRAGAFFATAFLAGAFFAAAFLAGAFFATATLPPVSMDSAPLQSSLFTTLTEHDTKDKGIRVEADARVVCVVCEQCAVRDAAVMRARIASMRELSVRRLLSRAASVRSRSHVVAVCDVRAQWLAKTSCRARVELRVLALHQDSCGRRTSTTSAAQLRRCRHR